MPIICTIYMIYYIHAQAHTHIHIYIYMYIYGYIYIYIYIKDLYAVYTYAIADVQFSILESEYVLFIYVYRNRHLRI